MSIYFNVSDMEFNGYYAKDAMKEVVDGLNCDTLKTIEIVDYNMVDNNHDNVEWVNTINDMDVIVPGDIKLLNMAGVEDRLMIREVEKSSFMKMFLRYMDKYEKDIFIIALNQDELDLAKARVVEYVDENKVEGMSVDELTGRSEDEIINEINALEPDCILSVLPSAKQEEFIRSNKAYINAGIWLGCGYVFGSINTSSIKRNLLSFFKKDKNNM